MKQSVSFRTAIRTAAAALILAGGFASASLLAAEESQHDHAAHAEMAQAPAVDLEQGRTLFNDWSCGSCHALKDGGGSGHVGPSLDGAKLTTEFVVGRVTNGQGAMPAFGGIMTDEEIATLANYIVTVAEKPE